MRPELNSAPCISGALHLISISTWMLMETERSATICIITAQHYLIKSAKSDSQSVLNGVEHGAYMICPIFSYQTGEVLLQSSKQNTETLINSVLHGKRSYLLHLQLIQRRTNMRLPITNMHLLSQSDYLKRLLRMQY